MIDRYSIFDFNLNRVGKIIMFIFRGDFPAKRIN